MNFLNALRNYFVRHIQVSLNSLGRLYRSPMSSIMTIMVIGIALALPVGLHLITGNLQHLGSRWDSNSNLSLFLKKDLSVREAEKLADKLRSWPEIQSLQLITPDEALMEFRELSGFGDVLDTLDENPLPAVLAVQPAPQQADAASSARLLERLRILPEVDLAQLDLQWVKRFSAIVDIIRHSIWLLASLLGLAVLLIIGNTIRLEIQSRHEEIEVTKLIGATNGFIRRPFLYSGIWYGFLGGLAAAILVELAFWQLVGPVQKLAGLYQSNFTLQTLSLSDFLLLIIIGSSLGLIGSWLATGRHLAAIEPT